MCRTDLPVDLSISNKGFKRCCISNSVHGREDKKEGWDVDSEYECGQ
jgi:hypothetical protein